MQIANLARWRFTRKFIIRILVTVLYVKFAAIFIPEYLTPLLFLATANVFGGGLNYLAIASNGWYMPVRVTGEDEKRRIVESRDYREITSTTRFKPLCDIFNFGIMIVSVGDLIPAAGFVGFVISHIFIKV